MMICIGNTALHRIKRGVHQAARAKHAVVLCRWRFGRSVRARPPCPV